MMRLPSVHVFVCSLVLLLIEAGTLVAAAANEGEAKLDFNYDIQPIISQKCFSCHGPDDEAREAKLRLDLRDEAIKERDGIRAIVPGDPAASEIIARITSKDRDEVMPPPKEGHPLTEREIELVKKWVAQGAEYKTHWAWTKPERPPIPEVADPSLVRNPIDAFIIARLQKAGLKPSPEADRPTLIRRLSLDLIGLPPTSEEVSAFVADRSPDLYDKAVDRLLASPHFGEKWARLWLDLARYADSTGYGSDAFRLNIWPYRDWVINAFNRNLPYDQFTTEQLAGDLLPNATPEQIAATAFHRNTMTNTEGGTIDEEWRVAAVKDRIATTAQVWTGLTMQCAQCHTHKFDPITHKDYYQFFGVFNQTEDNDRPDEEPKMPLPTAEQQEKMKRVRAEIAALEAQQKGDRPEFETEQHAWEAEMNRPLEWKPLEVVEVKSDPAVGVSRTNDGAIAVDRGAGPSALTIKTRTSQNAITALRLEWLPASTSEGQQQSAAAEAALSELRVKAVDIAPKPIRGRIVRLELPGERKILSLAELQILAAGENAAVRGRATQSSTAFSGAPERAIDGNTDGVYTANSVSHTNEENNPWWEVDLGAVTEIDSIVLWNRTDAELEQRLKDFRLLVLDADRQPVWNTTVAEPPRPTASYGPTAGAAVALRNPSTDLAGEGEKIARAIDGDPKTQWTFAVASAESHAAVFETATPIGAASGSLLTFTLQQNRSLGRFRLFTTTTAPPVRELPKSIRAILALEPTERSEPQRTEIAAYFRPLAPSTRKLVQEIEKKKAELAAIKPIAVPVMRELPADKRRATFVMNKGNYLAPGEKVDPGLPSTFASFIPADRRADRLAVAQWLMHGENPLTARVAVNRFWSQLFGTGIVETEEDFGTQGALPSHPELLDWLAVTFRDGSATSDSPHRQQPWDMKAMLKLIVTSATYRQSAKVTPELLEADPRNRLFGRYPRRRLEAEAVRDQALVLAGLLSRKIGGPSVYPPQPEGLWKVAFNGGQNAYPTSTGEDRYRRGLYTFWRRTMPNPSMTTFDAPSRETCTLRRTPTNTPLQAFVTLNDPCFVECAQALARRIVREGGSETLSRARWALQLVTARPAEEAQAATLTRALQRELATFKADAAAAAKLATEPLGPLPPGADAAELAAWTVMANVLLNLDAVLMKG